MACANMIVQKRNLPFKYVSKEYKTKLRQMKKDEIKEESYLNYTTVMKYAFCFLVCLFFICNLINIHKKFFFFPSNLLFSLSVTIIVQKGCVGVCKVFSSIDLTLLFYRVCLWFILDLRRTKTKYNCAYFRL